MRRGSCVSSSSRHRLSATAEASGKPSVAAWPLMSWLARNSASRCCTASPFCRMSARALSSCSHSSFIQPVNSVDSSARAASARATGSSAAAVRVHAPLSLLGGVITWWSAKLATLGLSPSAFVMGALPASARHSDFVEQGLLLDDVGVAALAPFGPDIGQVGVAAPVRPEIGPRLDERPWAHDDIEDALIERLGGDRLRQELGHARVARRDYALLLRMTAEHDDRHVRVRVGAGLPDHLGELEPVEDRHRPVGDDDIGNEMHEGLEAGRSVLGL